MLKHVRTILLACALLGAAPALAQLKPEAERSMTAEEATAALFGIDMEGYSPSENFQWRECIQPDGETLYETPFGVQNGRLMILDDGHACFAYEDDDYMSWGCFSVHSSQSGLVFRNEDGATFITTRIFRGVRNCRPQLVS